MKVGFLLNNKQKTIQCRMSIASFFFFCFVLFNFFFINHNQLLNDIMKMKKCLRVTTPEGSENEGMLGSILVVSSDTNC